MNRKLGIPAIALLAAFPLAALAADPATRQSTPSNPPTRESTGEYVDDAAITAKIKAAFVKDSEVRALDVKVETVRGVVQLSGTARSNSEIERAGQIARNVPGVTAVRNDLRLR